MQPKIYKYILQAGVSKQELEMPSHHILTIQKQGDRIALWACVLPESKVHKYTFYIRGTGHEIDTGMLEKGSDYLATVQMNDGLTWHIFKEKKIFTDEEKKELLLDNLKTIFPEKSAEQLEAELKEKTGGHGVTLERGDSIAKEPLKVVAPEDEKAPIEQGDAGEIDS